MSGKNRESEPGNRTQEGVPILGQGIGTRVKAAADRVGSRADAARAAGISDDMLYRYIREESPPRFEAMVGLARAAGVSLEWLAYGSGEPDSVADEGSHYATGDTGRERPPGPSDAELRGLGERFREIRTTIDQAVAEVGYDPGKWVREGLTTALFKGDLKPEGVVTLLQFLEAQHLDNR